MLFFGRIKILFQEKNSSIFPCGVFLFCALIQTNLLCSEQFMAALLLILPPPPPPPLPPYLRVYFLDAPLIKSLVKWTEGDVITLTTCHLCNLLTIINFRKIHLTKLMTLTINKGYHRIRVQFHIISDKVHRKWCGGL